MQPGTNFEIDDETELQLLVEGVAVTGREMGESRHYTVMVPINEKSTEAWGALHKHMRGTVSRDKLDGK